ncbi:MAG: RodZ domain-containing protein, partial [Myxococcota bacterium]
MEGRGSSGGTLTFARTVGFVSVVMWVLAVAVFFLRTSPVPEPEPLVAAGSVPTEGPAVPGGHALRIAVQRPTELRVTVDGAVVVDRRVEPREELAWEGARTFTVERAAPEALRIEWNGQRVVPLGR